MLRCIRRRVGCLVWLLCFRDKPQRQRVCHLDIETAGNTSVCVCLCVVVVVFLLMHFDGLSQVCCRSIVGMRLLCLPTNALTVEGGDALTGSLRAG